jgi:protein SCO1
MRTVLGAVLLSFCAAAYASEQRPAVLKDVGIEQRLGEKLPLEALFADEAGKPVRLGQYFGRRPVILVLAYYNCPMLCTQVFNGLVSTLRVLRFDAGKDFEVVAVSFDPRDRPTDAAAKKKAYVDQYGREGAGAGWHFLTGGSGSIEQVTKAAGFRYKYDDSTGQFAHAAALYVATAEGKLSRYFYGIEYGPRDLRLAVVEASEGRIGNLADQILLFCFHYDPKIGRYSAAILSLVRFGGVAAVLILSTFLFVMWRREKRRPPEGPGRGASSLPSEAREEARAAGAERGARDQASGRARIRASRSPVRPQGAGPSGSAERR